MRKVIFACMLIVLCSSVSAIGYAPITIFGDVVKDDMLVNGATVWAKGYVNGTEMVLSDSFVTSSNGEFLLLLTVEDPLVIDIMITVEINGAVFTELVEDVSSWEEVRVSLDVSSSQKSEGVMSSSFSPSLQVSDKEWEALEEEDVSEEVIREIEEEHVDIVVYEAKQEVAVVEESPLIFEEKNKRRNIIMQFSAILLMIACTLGIRLELIHHRKKK